MHYSAVQYSTVQYSTVQYSTVQYSAVSYTSVQYSTVDRKKGLNYNLIKNVIALLVTELRGKEEPQSIQSLSDPFSQ